MTASTLTISPPSSKAELTEAIDDVVTAAGTNSVDITGGYQVQDDGTERRYGVESYRVSRASDDRVPRAGPSRSSPVTARP